MILKIVLVVICALLLFISYRARAFAKKVLKKSEEQITEKLIIKIKSLALAASMVLFVCTMYFIK